ncbi:MAG: DHH family phosphoesterase [Oscillospiraceae bacterium]|nr:DHH family phosphoesterase [Oscillospiraceae bacterium]
MIQVQQRGNARTIRDLIGPRPEPGREYAFNYKNSIQLIQAALSAGQPITVIGDYDADGVCASSILFLVLRQLGAKPAIRLPLRFAEGYGMSPAMIDEIESGLVITVDNGITAHEAAAAAKAKGLTLLITDHHLPDTENGSVKLPEADCVIDPHIEELTGEPGYDFAGYCGAGIAFKLAEKLLCLKSAQPDPVLLERLYAFAAIATVADVMDLTEENFRIVRRGIAAMLSGRITAGLQTLLEKCGIPTAAPEGIAPWMVLTGEDLGFRLGPCINAPSRMVEEEDPQFPFVRPGGDGAKISMNCLLAAGKNAESFASALNVYNTQRKAISEKMLAQCAQVIREEDRAEESPLVLALSDLRAGLTGTLAGRLSAQYGVPVILMTQGDDGICHGSCRSPEGLNIREKLDGAADLLLAYGGHAGAAGVSMLPQNVDAFRQRMIELCDGFRISQEEAVYDLELQPDQIGEALQVISDHMAPFGHGNPEPVFLFRDLSFRDVRVLKQKHIRFNLENSPVGVIGFNLAEEGRLPPQMAGGTVSFLGRLGYNIFQGRAIPQITLERLL